MPDESLCFVTGPTRQPVAERKYGAPFVAQPVTDRAAARDQADRCAREMGTGPLELIRESMCSTFTSGDVVIRVGHFGASPRAAAQLAGVLRRHNILVPNVVATFEVDEDKLGAIAYERVEETGSDIEWAAVGAMVKRLHTTLTVAEIPEDYPIAQPGNLPWWNFPDMISRLGAAEAVTAEQLKVLRAVAEDGDGWVGLAEATPSIVSHGDIHPGNVIMSDDGPMLIDWDLLSVGSSLWDHVPLRAWSSPPWQGSSKAYHAFAAGYGEVAWSSHDLDQVVHMRNLAATLLRLIGTSGMEPRDEEAVRRLTYWVSPEMASPWTWG